MTFLLRQADVNYLGHVKGSSRKRGNNLSLNVRKQTLTEKNLNNPVPRLMTQLSRLEIPVNAVVSKNAMKEIIQFTPAEWQNMS